MPVSEHHDFIQSLERGLAVLRVFSHDHPAVTVSEAAELAGVTRATARRILLTLEQLGYVSSDGRRFAPAPRLLSIGYAYLSSLDLWDVAEPYMSSLAEVTRESCSAATLDGAEIVYVARVPGNRVMGTALRVGSRLPAYATSMGRVLLAGLDPPELDAALATAELRPLTPATITDPVMLRTVVERARADGWCLVDEELEPGLRSIAAPIRDKRGRVVAALNVSANAGRVSPDQMRGEFLPPLLHAAAMISETMARR
jgi:IclR family pca regulon transcriptional regulator